MNLSKIDTYVINLEHREDKKNWMKSQMKMKKLPIHFFTAKIHSNPKRGCLESHLYIITKSLQQNKKQIFILEDDALFLKKKNYTSKLPSDWCMAYLGGTVTQRYEDFSEEKPWIRMACYTTHAYLVNFERKDFVDALLKMKDYPKEIDKFYMEEIHPNFPCYMINPMMAIQNSGYSDIECATVNYDFMIHTLRGLNKPLMEIKDNSYILKLPVVETNDLPYVSIITPTFERRKFFPLALHNFRNFDYPKEKLEWIIIDDSEVEDRSIEDLIPAKDSRIRYLKIQGNKSRLTISHKRNIGVENAKYNYIVHMDDDDYYPPESILARIKTLLKYESTGIECVGCSQYGIHNIMEDKSTIASDGPLSLSEASMAYKKTFWENQKFVPGDKQAEYRGFIMNRYDKCMDLPYEFVFIAMSHNRNFTGTLRHTSKVLEKSAQNEKMNINYVDQMDEEIQEMIMHIRASLLQPEVDFDEIDRELGLDKKVEEK